MMGSHSHPGVTRVLITVQDHQVSFRFDMTLEVIIAEKDDVGRILDEKYFLLSGSSAEELCNVIQNENVHEVICGGIEDEYYQYLSWKKVTVFCNIIGSVESCLEAWRRGVLVEDTIFNSNNAG